MADSSRISGSRISGCFGMHFPQKAGTRCTDVPSGPCADAAALLWDISGPAGYAVRTPGNVWLWYVRDGYGSGYSGGEKTDSFQVAGTGAQLDVLRICFYLWQCAELSAGVYRLPHRAGAG